MLYSHHPCVIMAPTFPLYQRYWICEHVSCDVNWIMDHSDKPASVQQSVIVRGVVKM